MVSSAVYRYFPSRDALLTALIIDSFDAVGAAAEEAVAGPAPRRAGPLAGADQGDPGVGARQPPRLRPRVRQPRARLPGAARTRSRPPAG